MYKPLPNVSSQRSSFVDEEVFERNRVREAARLRQRAYRRTITRIDYHPDRHAAQVIDSMRRPFSGGDASSIINRIIDEWSAQNTDGSDAA